MLRPLRRGLHKFVEYDALSRRKRGLFLFFAIGLVVLIGLSFAGYDTTLATSLWFLLLVRLLLALVVAAMVLPGIWWLRRHAGLKKTPAALLFLVVTVVLTIGLVVILENFLSRS